MRDNNDSHIALSCLVADPVPDLRLCDDIEHRTDLIADQKRRACHQGSRHTKTLQLPAGQLPWKPLQPFLLNAIRSQHVLLYLAALLQHLPKPPAGIDRILGMLTDQLYWTDTFLWQWHSVQQDLPSEGVR